jgi:hypothetical protein
MPSEGKVRAKFNKNDSVIEYPTQKKLPSLDSKSSIYMDSGLDVYKSVQRPVGHMLLG